MAVGNRGGIPGSSQPHPGASVRHRQPFDKPFTMRIVLNVLGILCLLVGCIWILQGINVLPGSFMSGQSKWAMYGGALAAAAIVALVVANRRRV